MDDLMKALGFYRVEARPLQVGDWVELVFPTPDGLSTVTTEELLNMKWPRRVTSITDERWLHVDGYNCAANQSRFRRVDPPTSEASDTGPEWPQRSFVNASEVAELRLQLADAIADRDSFMESYQKMSECMDELKQHIATVTRERDEAMARCGSNQSYGVDSGSACGRNYLSVCGFIVVVEGDIQRDAKLASRFNSPWNKEAINYVVEKAKEHDGNLAKAERERDELRDQSVMTIHGLTAERNALSTKLATVEAERERMQCGHLRSSIVTSVESGANWCGECDMQSRLSDAVQMEKHNKEQWDSEKERRVYYQNIVYAVCNLLDSHLGYTPGQGIVTGTVETPSTMVSDTLEKVLLRCRQLDKAEADAAAMRRTMTENESRLKDVIRRIGVSTTTGWITHELNHVLLDIPSGTAGRELLERHKKELAELRVQLDNERQFFAVNQHTIEAQAEEIKRLNDRLRSLDEFCKENSKDFSRVTVERDRKEIDLLHIKMAVFGDDCDYWSKSWQETVDEIERLTRKCRTSKAALVEAYRGKIDPAWFGEKSELYKYRTTANPSGVIWRTSDGKSCEASMVGHAWITATAYSSWQECCDDKRTYPCNADGTPLAKPTKDFAEAIEQLLEKDPKLKLEVEAASEEIRQEQSDDDAMLRKLRELLKQCDVCVCLEKEFKIRGPSYDIANETLVTLIAIRDGGGK